MGVQNRNKASMNNMLLVMRTKEPGNTPKGTIGRYKTQDLKPRVQVVLRLWESIDEVCGGSWLGGGCALYKHWQQNMDSY